MDPPLKMEDAMKDCVNKIYWVNKIYQTLINYVIINPFENINYRIVNEMRMFTEKEAKEMFGDELFTA